jgi:glycerol-3-phosphate acyltransferase PlsY
MTLAPYWLIAALVIFRHKDNIKRLLAGTEPKIGRKHD